MATPWPVSVVAGALLIAMAVALVGFAWPLEARARWVFVVRETFAALIGVGVAVEPWSPSASGWLVFVGLIGALMLTVFGRRLRGEVRRAHGR
jgi:hypothetical protein